MDSDADGLRLVTGRLALLVDMCLATTSVTDLPRLLDALPDRLWAAFPQAGREILGLYGPDGSLPTVSGAGGIGWPHSGQRCPAVMTVRYRDGIAREPEVTLSRTVIDEVRRTGEAVLVRGASHRTSQGQCLMCAPLLAGAHDLGFVQLDASDSQRGFSLDDLRLLAAIAVQVAIVIRAEVSEVSAARTKLPESGSQDRRCGIDRPEDKKP